MLIGQGFDAHRFAPDRPLVLGGVEIPHDQGMLAHSDGDVLIHALCDALLGAAGLGDIGRHFPDTDAAYEGIDSRILLRRVMESLRERGLSAAQRRHDAHRPASQAGALHPGDARDPRRRLGCDPARVNVKATTMEQMGFTGRGEGIAASAVVLLTEAGS